MFSISRLNGRTTGLFASPASDADASHRCQSTVDGVVFILDRAKHAGLECLWNSILIWGSHQLSGEYRLAFSNQILIGRCGFQERTFKSSRIHLIKEAKDIKIGKVEQFLMSQFIHEKQTLEFDVELAVKRVETMVERAVIKW